MVISWNHLKKKIASLVQCRPKCARGFRVSEFFCKRVPKARACKKFSLTLNPRNPTNRKATTNQIQEIRTFFRLGLGKKPAFMRYGGSRERAPQNPPFCHPKPSLHIFDIARAMRIFFEVIAGIHFFLRWYHEFPMNIYMHACLSFPPVYLGGFHEKIVDFLFPMQWREEVQASFLIHTQFSLFACIIPNSHSNI